jgi:DNA-binding NarL/FixJ family response regulator
MEFMSQPRVTEVAGCEDADGSRDCFKDRTNRSAFHILLVDDSPIVLKSVESLLATSEEIKVVATVRSGREALAQVTALEPDLVVMDLSMPGMDGTEATRLLALMPRPPRVILMTVHDDEAYRAAAEKAGADGFLDKADLGTCLLPLVHSLLAVRGGGKTKMSIENDEN